MAVGNRPRTERPKGPGLLGIIYDKLFHNYVWQSIFRSGYPNTPRNQMLVVATNVFLHLHPTRIHKTHVKITHTYCLGGLSFFLFLGLTVTGVLLMFYYVPSVGDSGVCGMRGGFDVGPAALIRFYTLHVIGLPLVAAIFMAVHFWRIRRDGGMARPL